MRTPWMICLVLWAVGSSRAAQEPALAVGSAGVDRDAATSVGQSQAELATLARIEALEQSVAQGADAEAVQRQVVELKQTAHLERLRLLAVECRLAGRLEEAALAEQELERLQAPAPALHHAEPLDFEEKLARERTQQPTVPTLKGDALSAPSSEEGAVQ